MMRRLTLAIFVIGLGLVSTGCLRTFTSIVVHRDGSATVHDTLLFSPRFLAMMQSMDALSDDETASKEKTSPWSDSLIASDTASFGTGVSLKEWHEITVNGMQGYTSTFTVRDVNAMKVDMDRSSRKMKEATSASEAGGEGDMEDDDEDEVKKDPIRFAYTDGVLTITTPPPSPKENPAEDAAEKTQEEKEQEEAELRQNLDMMSGFMRGIRVGVTVTVDGSIKETNATWRDGNTITLIYLDFDKLLDHWQEDLQSFKDFDAMQEGDMESMKRVMNAVPDGGMKIEVQPTVTIKF